MLIHHPSCPRIQFWDAGEWECPCLCPKGWPKKAKVMAKRKAVAQGPPAGPPQ